MPLSGTFTLQIASPMSSGSSCRTVSAPLMSRGPRQPFRRQFRPARQWDMALWCDRLNHPTERSQVEQKTSTS
jgi:hypothetical protein